LLEKPIALLTVYDIWNSHGQLGGYGYSADGTNVCSSRGG